MKIIFEEASKVVAMIPEFHYRVCGRAKHVSSAGTVGFPVLAPGPETVMEAQRQVWRSQASAAGTREPGRAEMRPASVLICIYPADDPLLSLLRWRHKLHPS